MARPARSTPTKSGPRSPPAPDPDRDQTQRQRPHSICAAVFLRAGSLCGAHRRCAGPDRRESPAALQQSANHRGENIDGKAIKCRINMVLSIWSDALFCRFSKCRGQSLLFLDTPGGELHLLEHWNDRERSSRADRWARMDRLMVPGRSLRRPLTQQAIVVSRIRRACRPARSRGPGQGTGHGG